MHYSLEAPFCEKQPPMSNTGATLTKLGDLGLEIGIHDYAGTTFMSLENVLTFLCNYFNYSVEVRPRGLRGYTEGYEVGHIEVYAHPERLEMGVHVLVRGQASDQIGTRAILDMVEALELRTSRGDVYIDHCPFAPEDLRDEWRAGNVRTSVKVNSEALQGREYKESDWQDSATGDTFYMGSRYSYRFARCYNKRGYTRLELELKGKRADVTFKQLLSSYRQSQDAFSETLMGAIRDFVDFVDPTSDTNISRAKLSPFWEIFTLGIARARIVIPRQREKELLDAYEHLSRNYAPTISTIVQGLGWGKLRQLDREGRIRQKAKHRKMLRRHLALNSV